MIGEAANYLPGQHRPLSECQYLISCNTRKLRLTETNDLIALLNEVLHFIKRQQGQSA